jgi:hypothetical protein
MVKFFYYLGLFLICFFLSFDFFNSYIYDPCGYVGTSNEPDMTDLCLSTSTDCCYIKWTYLTNTYYACFSKKKVLNSTETKNLTLAFRKLLADQYVNGNMTFTTFSKCNDSSGIILTPELKTSSLKAPISSSETATGRRLVQTGRSEMSIDYDTEDVGSIYDTIGYYLKFIVYKVLNLLFF